MSQIQSTNDRLMKQDMDKQSKIDVTVYDGLCFNRFIIFKVSILKVLKNNNTTQALVRF